MLQCGLLFVPRERDVQRDLVALRLCIFPQPVAALRNALGLHLEILHARHPFDLRDHGFALVRREQQTQSRRNASGVVAVDLRIRDLHLGRSERLDVVVGLLDFHRVERELCVFLQEKRRRNIHVLFRERDRHGRERHLRIHEFEFALHRLDLLAHTAQFLFNLEEIGDVFAFRFQNLDEPLLHQTRVLHSGFGIEIGLRHIFSRQRLIFQIADPAQFLKEAIQVIRQNFDHDFTAQLTIRLLLRAGCGHVSFFFRRKSGDFLNGLIEARDFQFRRRIANQLPIRGRADCGGRGRGILLRRIF